MGTNDQVIGVGDVVECIQDDTVEGKYHTKGTLYTVLEVLDGSIKYKTNCGFVLPTPLTKFKLWPGEIKVGDTVECVGDGGSSGGAGWEKGKTFIVRKVEEKILWPQRGGHGVYKGYAKLLNTKGVKKMLKTKGNSKNNNSTTKYTFRASWGMVDISKITEELSYKNPMAIVKGHSEESFVVLHDSLRVKVLICDLYWPLDIKTIDGRHVWTFENSRPQTIRRIKDWIREVKKTHWPSDWKPVDITVQVLSID